MDFTNTVVYGVNSKKLYHKGIKYLGVENDEFWKYNEYDTQEFESGTYYIFFYYGDSPKRFTILPIQYNDLNSVEKAVKLFLSHDTNRKDVFNKLNFIDVNKLSDKGQLKDNSQIRVQINEGFSKRVSSLLTESNNSNLFYSELKKFKDSATKLLQLVDKVNRYDKTSKYNKDDAQKFLLQLIKMEMK